MTNEEARKYILANYFDGDEDTKAFVDGDEEHWVMKFAIEALEKQIPKKLIDTELFIYASGTRTLSGYCPVCDQPVSIFDGHQNNKKFRRDEDVFCSYCGQALDWSE